MARIANDTPATKVVATAAGAMLTGIAIWLNAEHLAQAEGWHSPLTLACIGVTAAAAIAPPCAERAFRDWQPVKGALLLVFFLLAVAFSLTVSIGRAGGHRDAAAASGEAENMRARLAQQAYDDARAAVAAECATGRGKLCRAAEERRDKAREALAERAEVKPADSGATRIAHLLGIAPETVAMYAPLALPFALELGGFIFLAFGLAPRRGRKAELMPAVEKKPVRAKRKAPAKPRQAKPALGANVLPLKRRTIH